MITIVVAGLATVPAVAGATGGETSRPAAADDSVLSTANTTTSASDPSVNNTTDDNTSVEASNTAANVSYLMSDGSARSLFYTGGEIVIVGAPIDAAYNAGEGTVSLQSVETIEDGEVVDSSRERELNIETDFETVPFDPVDAATPNGTVPATFVRIDDDTSLPPGEYIIQDNGNRIAAVRENTVEIAEQSLSAEWEDTPFERNDETTTELDVESNRAVYNINVSAPGLDYEELEALFLPSDADNDWLDSNAPRVNRAPFSNNGDATDSDLDARVQIASKYADEDVIVLRGYSDGSLAANPVAADVDPGTVEFNLSVTDSAANADASLTVTDTDADASFQQTEYQTPAGGVVNITVELTGTDSTYLVVGNGQAGYFDVIYLEDDNDDNTVEAFVNTRLLGARPGEETLGGDDAVVSETDIARSLAATNGTVPPEMVGEAFENLRFEDDNQRLVEGETGSEGSLNAFRTALGLQPLVRPLQPSSYELRLTTNGVLAVSDDGELQIENDHDITSLELTEPRAEGVETYVAPPAAADSVPVAALKSSMGQRDAVALDDRLIIEMNISGYTGALSAAAVETGAINDQQDVLTERIPGKAIKELNTRDGEGITIEFVETDISGNGDRDQLQLDDVNEEALSAYVDPETGSLYLIIDTRKRSTVFSQSLEGRQYAARVIYEADDNRYRFPEQVTDHFDAAAPFSGGAGGDPATASYPYLYSSESMMAETTVAFEQPTIQLRHTVDETALLKRSNETALVGTTNVAPGAAIQLLLDGQQTASTGTTFLPFSETVETTVQADGKIDTNIDTTGGTVGQALSLTFQSGSRDIETTRGTLVQRLPTVSIEEPPAVDRQLNTVSVEAALPLGGYVVIYDEGLLDGDRDRSRRGVSKYLSPSDSREIEVSLDQPYRNNSTAIAVMYTDDESNGRFDNRDIPYRVDGSPLTDRVEVSVARPPTAAQVVSSAPDAASASSQEARVDRSTTASSNGSVSPREPVSARGATTGSNGSASRSSMTPTPVQSPLSGSNRSNPAGASPAESLSLLPTQPTFGVVLALGALCGVLIYIGRRIYRN